MTVARPFGPLPAAIALAAGIALAPALDRIGVSQALRWTLTAALILSARRHPALVVAAVVAAGAARGSRPPPRAPAGIVADDRIADTVVGVVEGPVVATPHGSGAAVGGVWVWAAERLAAGERIAATGLARHGQRRIELSARSIVHLGEDDQLVSRAWRWAAAIQAAAVTRIEAAGGDADARAALRGITVGDRSAVPPALDDRWRATGIYHVLSVSGLHLAVVAGLVFALLRRLVAGSPWGARVHPARWAAPPSLAFAIGYTLVTGAQLATLRALIVIALVLVGAMLDRPIRLIDALGAAAIALLAWHPEDLTDPAFQLSFVAALTLALRPRRGGWLVHGITSSAWIALVTAPITAFHFQQVSFGGVIGNLVLTPLLELLALPLALAGLALGTIGEPLLRLATWLVSLVDGAAGYLAMVMPIGRVALASGFVMVPLVAIAMWLATRRARRVTAWWLALCAGWALGRTPPPPGALRVTFVDVGQGDAAIVELPDGSVWLIDAGGNASARTLASASAPGVAITRALVARGHDRIDLAIVSHPHPDHYLGLAAIGVPIAELWSADELEPRTVPPARGLPSFTAIADVLAARGTRLDHPPLGVALERGDVLLEVLAPRYVPADGTTIEAVDPVRSVNDNSLVIAIHYRGRTLLFAGDVEREGEDALVGSDLARLDVVKVPHHGSPTSSSPAFVAATRPATAVISCGRANAFGFPSPAVVARWRAAGAEVVRTDTAGDVTVVVDAAGGLAVD